MKVMISPSSNLADRDPSGQWADPDNYNLISSGEDQLDFVDVKYFVHAVEFAQRQRNCPSPHLKIAYELVYQMMKHVRDSDICTFVLFLNKKIDVEFLNLLFCIAGNLKFPIQVLSERVETFKGIDTTIYEYADQTGTSIGDLNPERNKFPGIFLIHSKCRNNGAVRDAIVSRIAGVKDPPDGRVWKQTTIIVATEILSRGFDAEIDVVINCTMPEYIRHPLQGLSIEGREPRQDTEREQAMSKFKARAARTRRSQTDAQCHSFFVPYTHDWAADTLISLLMQQGDEVPKFLKDAQERFNGNFDYRGASRNKSVPSEESSENAGGPVEKYNDHAGWPAQDGKVNPWQPKESGQQKRAEGDSSPEDDLDFVNNNGVREGVTRDV